MIEPSWQAIVTQAVALIILIWLLNKLFFKKVLAFLDERRDEVAKDYSEAESYRAAMEAARADYEQRLRNIEAEAREHIQAGVKEAQQLRDQIMHDARAQGEALIQRAHEEIGREKQKALIELRTEMAELAVEAAGKILRRSVDPQTQRDLMGDFIKEVGQA